MGQFSIQGLNVMHCIYAGDATIKISRRTCRNNSNQKHYLSGDAEIFGDDR
jgi:hypothetical protein